MDNTPNSSVANFIKDQYLNPDVNQKNIGVNSARINKDVMLNASKAVLDISKGAAEPSSRDSMEFQRVYGPAEYLAEHILRDGGRVARDLLWKVTNRRGLDSIPSGIFNEHSDNVFNSSKLAQYIEGSSMWESLDNNTKLTRIGEGGIGDPQVAPDEMRTVQPSFMGYVDPVRSPECYSEDTEVYTESGWKLFAALSTEDKLACKVDGKLEYHVPKQIVCYDYTGAMVHGKNDVYIDFMVTPEHRMSVKYHGHDFEIQEAKYIFCTDMVPTLHHDRNVRQCYLNIGLDSHFDLALKAEHITWPNYKGKVYCATVPGGLMYVRRNECQGFWCGNSTRIGLDIFMAKNTKKGSDGRLYTQMLNSRTGKFDEVDSVTASRKNIGTIEYMNPVNKPSELTDMDWEAYSPEAATKLQAAGIAPKQAELMLASKDPKAAAYILDARNRYVPVPGGKTGIHIIKRSDVDYWLPNPDDSYSTGSNLVPMLSAIKGMRLLMGSKYFSIHGDEWVYILRADGEVHAGPVKDYIWKDGDQTYSVMSALEEEMVQVRGVSAHQTEDALCRLHLSGGVDLKITAGHSCVRLSEDGRKLEEVQTIDLRKGDLIPCTGAFPGYIPIYDIQTVSVNNAWLRGYCSVAGRVHTDGTVNIYTYGPAREHKVFKVLDGMMILANDLEVNGIAAGLQVNSHKARETVASYCGQDLDQMLKGVLFGSQQSKQGFITGLLDANLGLTTWECKGHLYAKLGFYSEEFRNMVAVIAGSCGIKAVLLETCSEYCVYLDVSSVRTLMVDPMPKIKHGAVPDIDIEMPDPAGSGRSVQYRRVLDVEILGPTPETVYDLDTGNNLFLCSIGVFVHNSQSLPLLNREAPMVQSLDTTSGRAMEDIVGSSLGTVKSEGHGVIQSITPDDMSVKYQDGTIKTYNLYNNFPANQKGYIQSYTELKPGAVVKPGQTLSYSNYTNKDGLAAGGTNLRTAYMSYYGKNYEDATVISESAAKKLTSEILYKNGLEKDKSIHSGKALYTSWRPGRFKKEQLETIGADGVVKPGTILQKGDPIVLAVRENLPSPGTMGKRVLMDMAETWEHDSPGQVVDVIVGKDGPKVYSKMTSPAVAGDKMCYSGDHDILTEEGWINVKQVLPGMLAISRNPDTGYIEHVPVEKLHVYDHIGTMFEIDNDYFSLKVTPEHKLYVDIGRGLDLMTASLLEGQDFQMTNAGGAFTPGAIGYLSDNNGHKISTECILLVQALLGVDNFALLKSEAAMERVKHLLESEKVAYHVESDRLIVDDRALISFVEELDIRHTYTSFFKAAGKDALDIFIDTALESQGGAIGDTMLDMVQAAAAYADRTYNYVDGIVTVDASNLKLPVAPIDMVANETCNMKVYCPELQRNHILFVRRRNKTCWCGNSGRYGNKGVIAEVIPDDRMPKDAKGRPFDVLMSPLGVLSRTNSSQNIELALGKIAEITGKPYVMPSFMPDNVVDYAEKELAAHGLKDTETVYDPEADRNIDGIQTGNMYFYRLKHTAEGKSSGRGIGGYTAEGVPASGGYEGSKRLGRMETVALAGHQAFEVLKDAKLIRGQANDEFWRKIRSGEIPVMPGEPTVYKKFFAHLQGAGIDVRKTKDSVDISALTDSGVSELAGNREVQHSGTYDAKHYNPIPGGLFGEDVFGAKGDRFGKITLDEPTPNPIMEKPLIRILGLTKKDFDAILDGEQELDGKTGGTAIKAALAKIDVKNKLKTLPGEIANAPASRKDKLVKEYRDLYRMFSQGIRPEEYMLGAIPVIPPQFRPITTAGSMTMVADSDYLYRQLLDARNDLREAKQLSPELEGEARKNLRRTYKELEGLVEPQAPELKNKNVSGLLKWALGSNPKMSAFSRRLLGSTLDTVGRGTVIPNPKLKLNELGVPIEMAWDVYEPFVTRDLVAHGYTPVDAADKVKNRDDVALSALQRVITVRPVLLNRAPSLHKYSIMAFKPVLVPGHAIQTSPSIVSPLGMDYDGDANYLSVKKYWITEETRLKCMNSSDIVSPWQKRKE